MASASSTSIPSIGQYFPALCARAVAVLLANCRSSCKSVPASFGAKSAYHMPSYRARRGPPIDGRCGRIAASKSAAFPGNGLGTDIGPRERRWRRATRRSDTGLFGEFELNRPAGLLLDHRRSIANPPARAHSVLSRTRSQPLNLLSMARLSIARSRLRPSSWSLTRIVHTSLASKGAFDRSGVPVPRLAAWGRGKLGFSWGWCLRSRTTYPSAARLRSARQATS
jgi:hypothetical protein